MFRRGAVLCAALALLAPAALANIEAGHYRGKFTYREQTVSVLLILQPVRLVGDPAGRIRMAHWACGFELQYAGATGQLSNYNLRGTGTGNCQKLTQGSMRVHPGGRGVQLELFTAEGRLNRKIRLARAQ